ncbi:hypothetical protein Pan44_14780 [Caulifigura coniformis]|uniref:Uncharacterized protein n=1 Tax=Caulifigura coniformis TaxID=2527983 RepID=A0A517SBE1_9PLAN|nr:hypothetical protein [Caulifigura coniformis]QDT53461.1 hypothetical protein Pan44_14780 [Caulifigura coniformis]
MGWTPIALEELESLVDAGLRKMSPAERIWWTSIRIVPQKWKLSPWGNEGGGFWVVAVVGNSCVYYNDIEDGFNVSRFQTPGHINNYFCNHAELQLVIRQLMTPNDGIRMDAGPPEALP